jgi:hypothetical protein
MSERGEKALCRSGARLAAAFKSESCTRSRVAPFGGRWLRRGWDCDGNDGESVDLVEIVWVAGVDG